MIDFDIYSIAVESFDEDDSLLEDDSYYCEMDPITESYYQALETYSDILLADLQFDIAIESEGSPEDDKLADLASRAKDLKQKMLTAESTAEKQKAMTEYNRIMQDIAIEEKNAKDIEKKKKIKKILKIVGASVLAIAAGYGIYRGAKAIKNNKNRTVTPAKSEEVKPVNSAAAKVLDAAVKEEPTSTAEVKRAADELMKEVVETKVPPATPSIQPYDEDEAAAAMRGVLGMGVQQHETVKKLDKSADAPKIDDSASYRYNRDTFGKSYGGRDYAIKGSDYTEFIEREMRTTYGKSINDIKRKINLIQRATFGRDLNKTERAYLDSEIARFAGSKIEWNEKLPKGAGYGIRKKNADAMNKLSSDEYQKASSIVDGLIRKLCRRENVDSFNDLFKPSTK